jgi:hypothetical protein
MAGSTQRDSTWQRRSCLAFGLSTTRHDLIRGAFQDERINYTSEFRSFRPFISFSERFTNRPWAIDIGLSYEILYAFQSYDQIDTLYNPYRINTYLYTNEYSYHILGIRAFVDHYWGTRFRASLGFKIGYILRQLYFSDSSRRVAVDFRADDRLATITYGPMVRASYEIDRKWALSLCLSAIHLGQSERFSDGITAVNFSLSCSYTFP